MKTQLRITSFSLMALVCLTLAALPASANLYDNGPINGTINAYTISAGYTVSNSFTLIAATNTVTSFSFGVWLPTGDVLDSVDWSMTSLANGGTTFASGTAASIQNLFQSSSGGYDVYKATVSGLNIPLGPGLYYLNLQNASNPEGDPVYWDESDGVACGGSEGSGLNCPSTAYQSGVGTIASESFTINGSGSGGTTPEPGTLAMFGSGVLGLGGLLRRRFLG